MCGISTASSARWALSSTLRRSRCLWNLSNWQSWWQTCPIMWTRLSPTAEFHLLQVQSGIEGKLFHGMQCVAFHSSLHLIRWLRTKNALSSILRVPFVLLSSVRRTRITNMKTMSVVTTTTPLVLPRNAQGVIVPFSSSSWRSIGIKGTNASTLSATWSTRWIAGADSLWLW